MTYAPKSRFAIGLSALSLVALSLGSLGCAGGSSSGGTGGSSATGTGGNSSGTGGSSTRDRRLRNRRQHLAAPVAPWAPGGSVARAAASPPAAPPARAAASRPAAPWAPGAAAPGGATGGSSGTGGSAGKGGSTGTGGSAGKSGTGGAAGAGATTFFTDDFESDTAGKQPAGFDNLIAYNFNTTNPQRIRDGQRTRPSPTAPTSTAARWPFTSTGRQIRPSSS